MRKKARWLTSVMLTAAMVMSCLPIASAKTYTPPSAQGSANSNPWGINVDLSGVPAQVQATVANMIAQGEEPMEKQTDALLAKLVERASGISLEAVKTSLGLELLQNDMGTFDTSRFNLTESQFNRVMREVLADYYLGDVAYECEVVDGKVTGINYVPKSEASDAMITAAMLAEDDEESVSSQPMAASFSLNNEDAAVLSDEDDVDENTQDITVKVNWKDNNKEANRPDTVTLILIGKTENSDQDTSEYYDQDDSYYYEYKFEFDKKTSSKTISVPKYDEADNEITYTVSENGIENGGTLNGKNGTYTVTYDQANYTVTNTADGKPGTEYEAKFDWVRDDHYVEATEDEIAQGAYQEINGVKIALTLVYDWEKKEIGYGLKTSIDFKLESVTLTPKDGDGSEKIVIDATDDRVSYKTLYAFQGKEEPDPSAFGDYASYASTIKYGTIDCDYGTFEDRLDVTASAEQIHWNQMLTFTRDYAKHFGVAGDFWTSKNTENTPYGAFKTQLDSYPEDYMPDSVMDYYMENMTLAYMSDEMNYGNLLDQRIKDCMDQLDDSMTDVQKYLVIHDWVANNCLFDMGLMSDMMAGTGAQPTPSQMTAFGALLYDAMGYDGCICLGYAATYALLIQHAFKDDYQEDGKWLNWEEVQNKGTARVDLVQIRFFGKLSDISVSPEFGGDGHFNSVHYYNAVRVGDQWYCVDAAYDDINPEVMSQCRVETDGNISHKYFMIAPTNMLGMFEDRIDYIDCLYDGVTFEREWDEENHEYKYETINGNQKHYIWSDPIDTNEEQKCKDDQYEATWFSGAVGEVTYDENYWYYVTGPSFSYASMMNLMNQMKDQEGSSGDNSQLSDLFSSDDPADKDRLVRRPRTAEDEPVDDGSSSGGGMDLDSLSSYDDPFDEILFHFGYGSVVPDEDLLEDEDADEEEKQGKYYGEVLVDEAYYDLYPDLVHSMGLYKGVLYFNLGNKIYTMTGATSDSLDGVAITLLKEYNDVYANSNGKNFTGMSFYAAEEGKDNAFHVFNRPIAAICIEDEVTYSDVVVDETTGQTAKVRNEAVIPTLTVSIGTNFSESNKDEDGNAYTLEALDYNPDYSMYNKMDDDNPNKQYENTNEEFLWCANVVDTMPMEAMLEELPSDETAEEAEDTEDASEATEDDEYVTVTIRAWCGQAGYTEKRTAEFGLSVAGTRTVNEEDPALNHHFIENEREECYVCVHCNDSWHDYPPSYKDGYEEFPEKASKGHTEKHEDGTHEFTDIVWDKDNHSWCKAKIKCAERYCDHLWSDEELECDVEESSLTDSEGKTYPVFTATYNGELVDKQYPDGKPAYTLGDVNDDGEINLKDVVLLHQYYAGGDVTVNELAADVNGDGAVTLKDVVLLRQYYAGWDVQLGKSEDAE